MRAPPASATPASASKASAAPPPASGSAGRARSRERSAPAPPSRRGRIRSTSAPTRGRSTCGTDGTCDGSGACRLLRDRDRRARRRRAAERRSRRREPATAPGRAGRPAPPAAARTSAARSGTCLGTCTADADCVAPNVCTGGSCGKRPNGATCTGATECSSGFCEQGTCCLTACSGSCRSCGLAGTAGTCVLVPAGDDPLGQCADGGASTCGTDGTCDGGGSCRLYASGTVCVPQSCTGATFTPARTCNGTGTCQTTTPSSCGTYVCGTGVCKTSCTADARLRRAERLRRRRVHEEADRPRLRRAQRMPDRVLRAGHLLRHRLRGHLPVVRAGRIARHVRQRPDRNRPAEPVHRPGHEQLRNRRLLQRRRAAAACTAPATQCGAATCTSSTLTSSRSCNGTGTCQAATTSMCDPYSCGAAACQHDVHGRHGLRRALHVHRRQLRQEGNRRHLRRQRRVRVRVLRPGCLLRDRVRRHLPVVRDGGVGRHVRQRTRRPGSAEPVRGSRRVRLQHRRHVQRQRRLPPLQRRHAVRGGDVLGDDVHERAQLQRDRHLPDRHDVQLRALRLRHGRVQDDLHDRGRLRVAQRLQHAAAVA